MWRLLLVSIFTWIIIFLSAGCSFSEPSFNQNTNESRQVNSNVIKGDNFIDNDSNKKVENFVKEFIKEIPPKLGLSPLTNTSQHTTFEFRLWINLGMPSDEKLLIVRSSRSDNQATLYHLRKTLDKQIRFDKEILANPKSGWNPLLSEISNQLVTPKRLVFDPQFNLTRHEGVICLEVVETGEYQSVFYGQHTKFEDGVRLKNLCEYLSGEFSINIDCRGERTTLGPIR
jgi:hypothetical protein